MGEHYLFPAFLPVPHCPNAGKFDSLFPAFPTFSQCESDGNPRNCHYDNWKNFRITETERKRGVLGRNKRKPNYITVRCLA